MENTNKDLFTTVCNVIDYLSEDLCMDVIIHRTITDESYRNHHKEDEIYYVCGNRGTICSDSVIKFYTTLFNLNGKLSTSLEMFSMWGGNLKKGVESNFNTESVMLYDRYECDNGEFNWSVKINSVDDLINVLLNDYAIEDYMDWDEESAIEECKKLIEEANAKAE